MKIGLFMFFLDKLVLKYVIKIWMFLSSSNDVNSAWMHDSSLIFSISKVYQLKIASALMQFQIQYSLEVNRL